LRLTKMLWILTIILVIFQGFYSYAKLPERMATHFSGSGKPDGWSNRDSFYLTFYAILLGLNLMFYAISRFMHKIPPSMVNMPNKQYWFSTEERKKVAMGRTRDLMFIVLIMMNVYFVILFEAIARTNTSGKTVGPFLLFIPTIIMMPIILAYVIFGFRKPRNHNES